MDFLRNLQIDRISFWIGFAAGIVFAWLASTLKRYLPDFLKFTRERMQAARESISTGVEIRLRNDMVRLAQRQHIASTLFSLDEVAIEPRLIAPSPTVSAPDEPLPIDMVQLTVPYTPDWPALAALYKAPTLTLAQSLQEGANLILFGNPGSGKTVALALLASQMARRDPRVGALGDYLPLYIHAVDIPLLVESESQALPEPPAETPTPVTDAAESQNQAEPAPGTKAAPAAKGRSVKPKTPLEILTEAVSRNVSAMTQPRLPALLRSALENNRLFLLLDGLDELPNEHCLQITKLLTALLQQYPGLRAVVATSPNYFAGLPDLGFQPVAMADWGADEKASFIEKWGGLWTRYIIPSPLSQGQGLEPINTRFLNNWLIAQENMPSSPLELTLKTWAAYAGDILGPDTANLVEAYLRRMTVELTGARLPMGLLAMQMVTNQNPVLGQSEAEKWAASLLKAEAAPVEETLPEDSAAANDPITEAKPTTRHASTRQAISTLTDSGVLVQHADNHIRFVHPVITGYLAAEAIADKGDLSGLESQPFWAGKQLTGYFLARISDIGSLVQQIFRKEDFLYRDQLAVARWLRLAPKNMTWRTLLLRYLVSILQKEQATLALATRIVTALALSGDPGVGGLFRQLLKSDQDHLRQVAALGCGLLRDAKAVEDLTIVMQEANQAVSRAACLALVAIGNKNALEAIADALLHGSEMLRRSAAEALANHPEEGYPALEEGSAMEDLMVRRSVVFGLQRVNQPWAIQILDKLQLEDKEWIVRNAANQVMEELKRPNPYIPRPVVPLTEAAWLIAFASKQGLTVAPGKPATDLVLQALKNGDEEQRLEALDYMRLHANAEIVHNIYGYYFGDYGEMREVTFNTLWVIAAAGIKLPSPTQYGFG